METAQFKTHGYLTISNNGGIEIMIDFRGDVVYYRFVYGQDEEAEIFEAEIEYNGEGDAFFMHGDTTYLLNEFMAVRS